MKDLTKGNIYKTFFFFGLPLVLSGLLSQMYNVIDTAIAGRFIGDRALAAIGATAPLISFISSLFWGYGVGFSIYIARLFGAGDHKKIKAAIYSTYLFLIGVSVAISAAMILAHDVIFDFLQIEPELRKDAFDYFAFFIGGLTFLMLSYNGVYIMTSFGIGGFPFLMSILSSALNIGGNIFSVVVLGWGIKGLAISSVVSAAVVDICYVLKVWSCFKEMNVHREKVKLGFTYIKKSLPYALPNMAQQLVMYFAGLVVSPLVNGIGSSASASYSVISRVYDINAHVYQNSARSVSNYSAQCVGKKEYGKLKKGVRVGLLQGIFFLTPFVVVCAVFHKQVCSLFFNAEASAQAKAYAYTFSKIYLPFIFINMLCNLFHGFYRGIKATKYLFFTTLVGAAARVVASLILIPKLGMNGFFIGWVISWAVEAIFSAILFFMGKWYRWEKPKEAAMTEIVTENQ